MKKLNILSLIALFLLSAVILVPGLADSDEQIGEPDIDSKELHSEMDKEKNHLAILWTSGDKDVAIKMVFMYAFASKKNGWWKDITFIIWGPSSKLTSEDSDIQEYIKKMMDAGIVIKACRACADLYGVSDDLASCGIEVKYIGKELTEYIKSETHLVTF